MNNRTFALALTAAALLALALRLAFRIDYAEEVDSIRFILALDRFDMAAYRPHFPGYPVFVLLGQLLYRVCGDAIQALSLLCAACGALLVLPAALLTGAAFGRRAALWMAAMVALNPLLWLYSDKLLSDMPGLLFLATALALLVHGLELPPDRGRRWLALGCLALGLTLGVRLSYFPFALSALALLLWRQRGALPAALGAITAGVLLWLVPLLLVTGVGDLLATGQLQVSGHFNRWGGSVVTQPDMTHRLQMLGWQLLAQGLGSWWSDRSWLHLIPTAGLVAALLLGLARGRRLGLRPLLLWALLLTPYLLWAFFGQNITVKPRHSLPLVLLLLGLCAGLAGRRGHGRGILRLLPSLALLLWLGGQAFTGLALAREHQQVPSNAVRMAREVGRICARSQLPVVVYTASFQRHLERHAPCAEVVVTRRINHVKRDLARRARRTTALVVSDIGRVRRLRRAPLRRYRRDRYIQNARHDVSLYRMGDGDGS